MCCEFFSTDLCQASFGQPRFLLPSAAHCSATLGMASGGNPQTWPIHRQLPYITTTYSGYNLCCERICHCGGNSIAGLVLIHHMISCLMRSSSCILICGLSCSISFHSGKAFYWVWLLATCPTPNLEGQESDFGLTSLLQLKVWHKFFRPIKEHS